MTVISHNTLCERSLISVTQAPCCAVVHARPIQYAGNKDRENTSIPRPQLLVLNMTHSMHVRADRAYRCSVCRELYSLAPRPLGGRWRLWGAARTIAATSVTALLALGLSGDDPIDTLLCNTLECQGTSFTNDR